MTAIKHAKTLAVPDNAQASAAGEALPSDWNADHVDASGNPLTVRAILTADANYYVSTVGSDSNNGSIGSPWATIQHAMLIIASTIDIAGFIINVHIDAGSFPGFGFHACVGGGVINFLGAGSSLTTITNGPNDGVFNFGDCFDGSINNDTIVCFDNMTFKPGPGRQGAIAAFAGAGFYVFLGDFFTGILNDIVFDTSLNCRGFYVCSQINQIVEGSGTVSIIGSGTLDAYIVGQEGISFGSGASYTIVNSPTFTLGFIFLNNAFYFNYAAAALTGTITGHGLQLIAGSSFTAPVAGNFIGTGSLGNIIDASSNLDGRLGHIEDSGLPTASQFPVAGTGGIYKDTSGGGIYSVYNDGGVIKKVALT